MLQFKGGQFQEIDDLKVLPLLGEDGSLDQAIRGAGFESWQAFGAKSGDDFCVEIYRRYDVEARRAYWLVEISHSLGGYEPMYCDSDADFMTLFVRLGPLLSVATMKIITDGVEYACDELRRNRDAHAYDFGDLLLDLVKSR